MIGGGETLGGDPSQRSHVMQRANEMRPHSLLCRISNFFQIEVTPPTPGMEEVELNDSPETAAEDTLAPPTQKKRIPPFFITPRADFSLTLNILRLTAPSLRSQMSNKFLKLTVETEDEHRALSRLLAAQGVEFKTFNLKQDRPLKIVFRGLPTCTPLDAVKNEIIKAGFDVVSISWLSKF
ncbi:hypothetical protein AVEN_241303-1 [Araneus ventricosus]|uniref:Pre-C2HC domain-containing protein n=1 Tax=Araneus ventricosus TaxID=182803 RepID=A0A4Y2U993_ARAVE|nr:hypothetical protein AVEN_241303-1 [Araneus ventricosus]